NRAACSPRFRRSTRSRFIFKSVNNRILISGGTTRLAAGLKPMSNCNGLFSNANLILRPGQYGRVRAQTQTITNALIVPQRAVTELQGAYHVLVVDNQNRAH